MNICPLEPNPTVESLRQVVLATYGATWANRDYKNNTRYFNAITGYLHKCRPNTMGAFNDVPQYVCETHGILFTEKNTDAWAFYVSQMLGMDPYCQYCGAFWSDMPEMLKHLETNNYCNQMVQTWPMPERHPMLRNLPVAAYYDEPEDEDDGEWDDGEADILEETVTEEELIAHHQQETQLQEALANATFATVAEEPTNTATIVMPNGDVLAWDETTQQYLVQ